MRIKKEYPKADKCICLNVRRASRAITRIYDQALAPSTLKVTQFSALMNINAFGPINVTALAKILVLDRTTLIRNLKLLTNAGFIQDAPGEDPRERQISITSYGKSALELAIPGWRAVQKEMAQQIGQENLKVLEQVVNFLEDLQLGEAEDQLGSTA